MQEHQRRTSWRQWLVAVVGFVVSAAAPVHAQTATPASASGSPAPPTTVVGRVLSLGEAVAIALDTQPEIRARVKDYAGARFAVDEALAAIMPQLTATASSTKSQSTFVQTNPVSGVTSVFTSTREFQQTFNTQLQLSQVLFDFGQNHAAVTAARKVAESSFENIEVERLLIADSVKEAYTSLNLARRLISVAEQSLARAQLNLRSARGFYETGTQPRSAVTLAEVDVANAQVAVIQAHNAEDVARVALNTAMGLAVDNPTEVLDNLVYAPVPLDPGPLHAAALAQRPEYRQAKLSAEAAEALRRQVARSFLPVISGNAFYGGATTTLNQAWAATLSMTWPIFDGGNTIAKYQQAKAVVEAAQLRVKASSLTIAQQVEQARLAVREAAQRIQAAQSVVAAAQENFRLAQGRYDVRVGTILELSTAQLALTQAQNTEAQALSDYQIGLARLDLAVGRR